MLVKLFNPKYKSILECIVVDGKEYKAGNIPTEYEFEEVLSHRGEKLPHNVYFKFKSEYEKSIPKNFFLNIKYLNKVIPQPKCEKLEKQSFLRAYDLEEFDKENVINLHINTIEDNVFINTNVKDGHVIYEEGEMVSNSSPKKAFSLDTYSQGLLNENYLS